MKKVVFISSLATLLFYGLFLLFYDLIHQPFWPVPDEVLINPWLRGRVFGDGVEVPVMLLGSIVYVGVLFGLFRKIKTSRGPTSREVGPPWGAITIGFLVLFSIFIFLSLDHPILWDYNFFIGPAWKMVQGEVLGTFYMRYSLLMTSLFAGMLRFDFQLPQMQLVIAGSFVLWFFLYLFVANRLIRDKTLVLLFVVALIVIRYLAIFHDPTVLPQNAPLRLDLWVLPFLVALRFGATSIATASAFSFAYVLDNTFGFFALVAYGGVLVFSFARRRLVRLDLRRLFSIAIPVVGAVSLQLFFFRSLISVASSEFLNAQVDFIPIGRFSLFWLIFALLPYYVFVVSAEKERRAKSLLLLLLALSLTHLTYFYGRSHDNSLLNISGIFVIMLFVALDRFGKIRRRTTYIIAVALIACSILFFWKNIESKFALAIKTIQIGQLMKPHPVDEHIEAIGPAINAYKAKSEKLFFLSIFDGYYHYRLGVPQPGFYTPLFGSVYLKDVVDPLTSYLKNGYTVLFFEPQVEQLIPEFKRFDYQVNGRVGQLLLRER